MKTDCVGGLMETAMENIKGMVEVNTIIGDAVETPNGTVIIPVSKMCCGFASGGTHFTWKQEAVTGTDETQPPFGGGAGAGVSVQPVGFLLVGDNDIRFQVVDHSAIFDRLLDEVPQMVDKLKHCKKDKTAEFSQQLLEQVLQDSIQQEEDKN